MMPRSSVISSAGTLMLPNPGPRMSRTINETVSQQALLNSILRADV
jgi:hypothetical protein